MKKLLTLTLSLTPTLLFSQELTADSVAVAPTLWAQIIGIVGEALLVSLKAVLTMLALKALPLLNAYLKQIMHFRGASVVADALTQALAEMTAEVQQALADGTIDAGEKAALMLRARQIAEAKLKNLSGFYKADLHGWIDDQLNVALSKILARFSV